MVAFAFDQCLLDESRTQVTRIDEIARPHLTFVAGCERSVTVICFGGPANALATAEARKAGGQESVNLTNGEVR